MKHNANCCEKTKRTVRARTYCIYAFRSVVYILHGSKKGLRVAKRGGGGGGAGGGVKNLSAFFWRVGWCIFEFPVKF